MEFVDGAPLLEVRNRMADLPEHLREAAKLRILSRCGAQGLLGVWEGLLTDPVGMT